MRSSAVPILLMLVCAGGGVARADAPALALLPPAPAGFHYTLLEERPTERRNNSLIIAGLTVLGGVWVASLQAGILTDQWPLDVPVFGPFIEIANAGWDHGGFGGWLDFALASDAAVQICGLVTAIAGGLTRHEVRGAPRLLLVPTGAGAALRGTF